MRRAGEQKRGQSTGKPLSNTPKPHTANHNNTRRAGEQKRGQLTGRLLPDTPKPHTASRNDMRQAGEQKSRGGQSTGRPLPNTPQPHTAIRNNTGLMKNQLYVPAALRQQKRKGGIRRLLRRFKKKLRRPCVVRSIIASVVLVAIVGAGACVGMYVLSNVGNKAETHPPSRMSTPNYWNESRPGKNTPPRARLSGTTALPPLAGLSKAMQLPTTPKRLTVFGKDREMTTTPPEIKTQPPKVTTAPEVVTTTPEAMTTTPEVVTTTPEVMTTTTEVMTTPPSMMGTTSPEMATSAPNFPLRVDPWKWNNYGKQEPPLANGGRPRGQERSWTNDDRPRGQERPWTNDDRPRGQERPRTNDDRPRTNECKSRGQEPRWSDWEREKESFLGNFLGLLGGALSVITGRINNMGC
ncbi:uncharacterized protein LOC118405434 [Branchiostoma floridae]|uniref:Uncharacterized protein LOC118405434 n=1 Tax=Branchiostoma floridae TaxID=7739 RepID=A0A9J7HJZ8_BRAFL|nr:uncharacterized protein LOC118405434 [Branchiostoma floridae]